MLKGIAQWQSLFVFGMAEVAETSPLFRHKRHFRHAA